MSGEFFSSKEPDDELKQLVEGLIDGVLSVDEQRHLEDRLSNESEAAEYCARRMRFDAELNECMNPTRFELVQSRRFVVEGSGENRRVLVRQTQEALIGRRGATVALLERPGAGGVGKRGISSYLPLLLLCGLLLGLGYLALASRQGERISEVNPPENSVPVKSLWQRRPVDDADLRYWLQNMVWDHRYENQEISAATGLDEGEIVVALERFGIREETRPIRDLHRLLTLPYPGGRHPRIGNLEQSINPQRETKVSVFAPWKDGGYVVLDLPEALSISETYFYLAHADATTIWERQNIVLPPLEWDRKENGQLESRRKLPNGVEFSVAVRPEDEGVRLRFSLHNGSGGPLRSIKIQNCVLLGRAKGFEEVDQDGRLVIGPYVACRSKDLSRWIITCWEKPGRMWGLDECPCMHCDPYLPVCQQGETITLNGWLSFYEGSNIAAEINRIEAIGWRKH